MNMGIWNDYIYENGGLKLQNLKFNDFFIATLKDGFEVALKLCNYQFLHFKIAEMKAVNELDKQ